MRGVHPIKSIRAVERMNNKDKEDTYRQFKSSTVNSRYLEEISSLANYVTCQIIQNKQEIFLHLLWVWHNIFFFNNLAIIDLHGEKRLSYLFKCPSTSPINYCSSLSLQLAFCFLIEISHLVVNIIFFSNFQCYFPFLSFCCLFCPPLHLQSSELRLLH